MGTKKIVLCYLLGTHLLLLASSPQYRHEVSRGLSRAVTAWRSTASAAWAPTAGNATAAAAHPRSGVYASTDLLHVIQSHMALPPGSKPGSNASNSSRDTSQPNSGDPVGYSTGDAQLIAYLSASDVIQGQGLKARQAFFMFLLAPRYLLSAPGGRFTPELDLLHLASRDLPAVGLRSRSQDPTAGYELSCTSPALSMGLGPQPFATCSVFLTQTQHPARAQHPAQQQPRQQQRPLEAPGAAATAGAPPPQVEATGVEPPAVAAAAPLQSEAAAACAGAGADAAAAGVPACVVHAESQGAQPANLTAPSSSIQNSAAAPLGGSSDVGRNSGGSSGSGSSDGSDAEGTCAARQVVATWTILPDSTPEAVAKQLQEIGAAAQPYLAGQQFPEDASGWIAGFLDVWLLFPRTALLRVIPALTSGLQQLQYGYTVLVLSYLDLMQLAVSLQRLQDNLVAEGQLLGISGWAYLMLGVSTILQVLLMTCVRSAVAAVVAYLAAHALGLVVHGITAAAVLLEVPVLHGLTLLVDPLGGLKGGLALGLTTLAVLRLQDVGCLLLWAVVCVLLLGAVFAYLADVRRWEEQHAALTSLAVVSCVLPMGVLGYFLTLGPSFQLPAYAASSSSWLLRLAARATAAAAGGASAAAGSSAAAAAGAASAGLPAAVLKTAAAVQGALLPWSGRLLALHRICEDAVMLTVATLVWEALGPLGDAAWRGCVELAAEAGVVLECLGACLMLLLSGGSWRFAWDRFWAQVQQRLQQHQLERRHANANGPHVNRGMQAQLVIHAQQAAFADMGHTAEALRALADELENLDGAPGGGGGGWLQQQQGGPFVNGRLVLPRQPRRPKLGTHWPAPLQVGFDVDDVRDELGVEVPRGFLCPLTLDVMKQPALLISSNIAVPSTYEKEAISRWLEDSSRDPKSRSVLAADAQLVPNFDLHRSIEDWAEHTRAQLTRHRQQQQQQQQQPQQQQAGVDGRDAAGAALGAGFGHGGVPLWGAAEAAAAPQQDAEQQQRQQPQTSSSMGSLLAAARGAVVAGTAAAAAAAAAAARAGRQRGRGRGQGGPAAAARRGRGSHQAAAAAASDPNEIPLSDSDQPSDSEDGDEGVQGGMDSDPDDHLLSDDAAEDWGAVHSPPGRAATPPAAAAAAAAAATVAEGMTPAAGRYNLRQRRSPG